jgi:intraflagellar transport protein 20
MDDDETALVTFDEDHHLRIFNHEKFTSSQELHDKSVEFTTKIEQFDAMMKEIMTILQGQGDKIDKEKLKVIGVRNKVKGEEEVRRNKIRDFQVLIAEKQTELERYTNELDSLTKIEHEQKKMIESLSSNEPVDQT